jgi:hypothetical protein
MGDILVKEGHLLSIVFISKFLGLLNDNLKRSDLDLTIIITFRKLKTNFQN